MKCAGNVAEKSERKVKKKLQGKASGIYKMHKKNKKNVANTEGKIKGKKICITKLIKTEIREESEWERGGGGREKEKDRKTGEKLEW